MWKKVGSPGRTRTCDILINSQALYRLSYRGVSIDDEVILTDGALRRETRRR